MSSWKDALADWGEGWQSWLSDAMRRMGDAVERNPEAHRDATTRSLRNLQDARADLDAIKANLKHLEGTAEHGPAVANFNRLAVRWWDLATGIYGHSDRAEQSPHLGFLPVVVLVVGAIGLTVAGVVAAVAGLQYTTNLREQTSLQRGELDARIEASKEGRTLQDSTLPKPPPKAGDVGWWLMGGLALVTAAIVVPQLVKKGA
jgi:hypothetical protein